MITIDKEVKVTITGADVRALSATCEMARQRIAGCWHSPLVQFEEREEQRIRDFLRRIFDDI